MNILDEIQKAENNITESKASLTFYAQKIAGNEQELLRLKTQLFAKVNSITKADVESCKTYGCQRIERFANIIAGDCVKRFAEWNDCIYYTSDLRIHNYLNVPDVRYSLLPEDETKP